MNITLFGTFFLYWVASGSIPETLLINLTILIMENIYIETQGVKGGNTKTQQVGFVIACLRHSQDRITIDDFEGFGASYKQRESQHIEIYENGILLFSGNKSELFTQLKK